MGKVLVIAEKPSVGRDIAKVLRATQKAEGYLYSEQYIVSWAVGHLVTLCEPEEYDEKYKRWRLNTLPIAPQEIKLKAIPATKKQLTVLKKLMNDENTDSIICATDSGREGELIFRYIYSIVKCNKPFKRLWISSMTDAAINEGFANLKDGSSYDNLYLSAKCRSEADWLVGMNATRAYTIKYDSLLSIGRVQTPTLAMIVERQKEILAFDAKDYWEIKCRFEKEDGNCEYYGMWIDPETRETKLFDKERAESIAKSVENKPATVTDIENEEKKQLPPQLYDLTELQRDCNKKFGYSAQKTLSIAQDLYEKRKLITYPRTDSRYLSDDLIPKITNALKKLAATEYKEFAEYVLGLPVLPVTKRIVDASKVSDHHAIIPTDININTKILSGDERNVYDAIVKRFIGVFYPPYEFSITRIITTAEGERFMTKGTTVVKLGYMELYKGEKPAKKEKDEAESAVLPAVVKDETVKAGAAEVLKKKTQPPKPYTEATLLSAMENAGRFVEDEALREQLKESGLGTPATRAATIERLLQVKYIERKAKSLVPTEKAMKLIEIVPPELKSPETTGKWERGLSSIARGKMDNKKFMSSIARYVDYIIEHASKTAANAEFPVEFPKEERKIKMKQKPLGVCPKCGNAGVLENSKSFYCGAWKNGCKFSIWKNSLERHGVQITPETATRLLNEKIIKGLELTMPQTGEHCVAELVLKEDLSGMIELRNLIRISNLEEISMSRIEK